MDEVQSVFEDPQTAQGLNIFVDARDDEHFAEGHIPGALQCFPYEAKRCLDRVKAAADGADKVIVYCEGGDCEDSIFMCRELTEAGVPTEAVFLFEGGWKEWSARGLPTEGGK
jgi:rhodanese-related sulfurtransferase